MYQIHLFRDWYIFVMIDFILVTVTMMVVICCINGSRQEPIANGIFGLIFKKSHTYVYNQIHVKQTSLFLLILLIKLVPNNAFAQQSERLEDLYMTGTWTASCPTEVVDRTSIRQRELCTFTLDPDNKRIGRVEDFIMTFNTDTILLNKSDKIISLPNTRNVNDHSIRFINEGKPFHFRVFENGENWILVKDFGVVMVLQAKL
jgi:hypothetical protein